MCYNERKDKEKSRKMAKIGEKKVFTMKKLILLICLACCTLFSSCTMAVSASVVAVKKVIDQYNQASTEIHLSGNFFDEEFMDGAELSWLSKPETATEEFFLREDCLYAYSCKIESEDVFVAYANYVYGEFHARRYYFGGRKTNVDIPLNLFKVYAVTPFLTLGEYKNSHGNYVVYYGNQGLEWSSRVEKMRIVDAKKLTFSLTEMENGIQLTITLDTDLPPVFVDSDKPPYVKNA